MHYTLSHLDAMDPLIRDINIYLRTFQHINSQFRVLIHMLKGLITIICPFVQVNSCEYLVSYMFV